MPLQVPADRSVTNSYHNDPAVESAGRNSDEFDTINKAAEGIYTAVYGPGQLKYKAAITDLIKAIEKNGHKNARALVYELNVHRHMATPTFEDMHALMTCAYKFVNRETTLELYALASQSLKAFDVLIPEPKADASKKTPVGNAASVSATASKPVTKDETLNEPTTKEGLTKKRAKANAKKQAAKKELAAKDALSKQPTVSDVAGNAPVRHAEESAFDDITDDFEHLDFAENAVVLSAQEKAAVRAELAVYMVAVKKGQPEFGKELSTMFRNIHSQMLVRFGPDVTQRAKPSYEKGALEKTLEYCNLKGDLVNDYLSGLPTIADTPKVLKQATYGALMNRLARQN